MAGIKFGIKQTVCNLNIIHIQCIKHEMHTIPNNCTYICVSAIIWNFINNKTSVYLKNRFDPITLQTY
jgi:hypothetical protein